jgi:hypothetical protein
MRLPEFCPLCDLVFDRALSILQEACCQYWYLFVCIGNGLIILSLKGMLKVRNEYLLMCVVKIRKSEYVKEKE